MPGSRFGMTGSPLVCQWGQAKTIYSHKAVPLLALNGG